jgi:undecaprenyl-diphosphatase
VLLGSDDKAFEVFAHAGTAAALLITLPVPRVRPLMLAPAAIAGLALERPIERRLGRRSTAVAQILGGLTLIAADAAPERHPESAAGARDELLIGLAQACALVPGVSRNGATLTAARWRGFRRADANALSRHVALPVIVGATALKGARLARRGLPGGVTRAFAAGIGAAFCSTLASVRLIRAVERDRSLAPYAAYRLALAAVVWRRATRA